VLGMSEAELKRTRDLGEKTYNEILEALLTDYAIGFDENREFAYIGLENIEKYKKLEEKRLQYLSTKIGDLKSTDRNSYSSKGDRITSVSNLIGKRKEDLYYLRKLMPDGRLEEFFQELQTEYGVVFNEEGKLVCRGTEKDRILEPAIVEERGETIDSEAIDVFMVEKGRIAELEALLLTVEQAREKWLGETIFLDISKEHELEGDDPVYPDEQEAQTLGQKAFELERIKQILAQKQQILADVRRETEQNTK